MPTQCSQQVCGNEGGREGGMNALPKAAKGRALGGQGDLDLTPSPSRTQLPARAQPTLSRISSGLGSRHRQGQKGWERLQSRAVHSLSPALLGTSGQGLHCLPAASLGGPSSPPLPAWGLGLVSSATCKAELVSPHTWPFVLCVSVTVTFLPFLLTTCSCSLFGQLALELAAPGVP